MSMPILLMRLWVRSRTYPAYGQRLLERLGYVRQFSTQDQCIWFHAVSLGESLTAIPLIKKAIEHYPNRQIVVTNMTPTGSEQIRKAFTPEQVYNCYLPYDVPHLMRRFFCRIKPTVAILLETELWPNVLSQCKKRRIPVLLTNARLSARSAKGYAYFGSVMRKMLSQLSYVAAQAQADGDRFLKLGLDQEKLRITGSVKFDLDISENIIQKGKQLREQLGVNRPVWIAASTHEGEEEYILKTHQQLLEKFPQALLVLVPRHPDRFEKVAQLIKQEKFSSARRSVGDEIDAQTQVYLGDTLGEMLVYFAASDIAFMGGSFVSTGGHNMLEPAALSKPVLSGPHVFNFAQIAAQLEQAGALEIVDSSEMLTQKLSELFHQPDLAQKMGVHGLEVLNANRGAADKQFDLIKQMASQASLD